MLAGELLKSKGGEIITIGTEASLDDAIALLAEKNIGAVIVTDSLGSIAGILSERDIIRILQGAPAGFRASPVHEVMTRRVITRGPDASMLEILAIMTEGRFRHVPIVEGGNLIGMVSIGDAVKARISQIEKEAEALKSYISAG